MSIRLIVSCFECAINKSKTVNAGDLFTVRVQSPSCPRAFRNFAWSSGSGGKHAVCRARSYSFNAFNQSHVIIAFLIEQCLGGQKWAQQKRRDGGMINRKKRTEMSFVWSSYNCAYIFLIKYRLLDFVVRLILVE